MDEEVEGFRVVAQALSKLGVKYMFGVVGIPVIEVKSFEKQTRDQVTKVPCARLGWQCSRRVSSTSA